jgi:thiol-disulfide isomerase/thioredoxin
MSAWFIAACEQPAEISATPELKAGYWQAEITLPGAIIDTAFELSHEGDVWRAFLINGRERIPIDEVSYQNRELTLRFPAFNNHIKAKLAGGRLIGNLTLVRRYGETQTMPFTASPGSAVSSTDAATDGAATDLSGRWAVRFHNQDGTDSASIGEFAQRGSKLFGTFLNPNGDHRFLAGRVTGNRFKLSTFDGAHAFAFEGVVIDDTIGRATFWSGTSWRQQWSASRNPDITLPDAFSRTFLKPGYERFEFEFPNLDGDPVSLDDEKFHGKVVIVTLAGTWCPNCNDEARFLAPFYLQYRDRGLEVVALMFEHFEDPETASRQIRNFRLKFDIQYETLLAGISDKDLAGDALPSLSAVLAWPTTIFIDRSSRVRTIHSGFAGPGTGEHYLRLQRKMTDIVTGLLNEPVDLLETLTQEAPTI